MRPPPPIIPIHEREPIYWFALAERAIHRHDLLAARAALARLAALGVEVRYLLPPVACDDGSAVCHVE